MTDKARIGFIGIGIMGSQMARRLAETGYPLTAWNRTREKAERLRDHGAGVADTAAETARVRDVVICMLSDGPTCDHVLIGPGGDGGPALDAMTPGATLVVMSSIPVETARHQAAAAAARGIDYLDAPVSGGDRGATDGTLAIMAGGELPAFERLAPIFGVMGRPTRVGPAGSGQLAKLANQMIVGNTIATVAEALLLATKGGADPGAVRSALLGGFADSTILRQHGERMLNANWVPGGPAKHQLKDHNTAAALADSLGLDLPMTVLCRQLLDDLVAHGDGEKDHSALYVELARRNGMV